MGDYWYYYYADGSYATGFQTIDGKQYYFNSYNGQMYSDYYDSVYGGAYLFSESGAMVKGGWAKHNGKWYYAGNDGLLLGGWQQIGNSWYYFHTSDHYMYVGAHEISGKMYYFSESGAWVSKAGWQSVSISYGEGKRWFYNDANGTPVTGWKKIDGTWYYFDENDGYMYTGAHYIYEDEKWFLFASSGAWVSQPGWQSYTYIEKFFGKQEKDWVYLNSDGSLVTGWNKINGTWYYFDEENSCSMNTGPNDINGVLYYFSESGAWVSQTGWQSFLHSYYFTGESRKEWVYVSPDGRLATGWRQIGSSQYYFDEETGFMLSGGIYYVDGGYRFFSGSGAHVSTVGWQSLSYTVNNTTSKEWYYINSDGTVATGWKTIGGKDYFFEDGYGYEGYNIGRMYSDGWHWIDGEEEFFDPSGACKTNVGWVTVDGYTRYRKSDGNYATGWYKVENIYYYFDNNGNMQTGWIKYGNSWYFCDPEMLTNSVVYQNGKYYYIEASGAMRASKGWVSLKYGGTDGTVQQFWLYVKDSSGVLANNEWLQVNGKWYYFLPNMVINRWVYDNGYEYFFGSDGVWTGEKREAYSSSSGYGVTEEGEEADYAVTSVFAADGDYVWQGVA